jgi:hypothetical protein
MAWHLAEIEGYITLGIANGAVTFQAAPPNMQRPREVRQLAPGYQRVHQEAVARLANLTDADLDREIPFIDRPMPIRDLLWGAILMHSIHHRGQLSLMCRLAGGGDLRAEPRRDGGHEGGGGAVGGKRAEQRYAVSGQRYAGQAHRLALHSQHLSSSERSEASGGVPFQPFPGQIPRSARDDRWRSGQRLACLCRVPLTSHRIPLTSQSAGSP